jgi:hypothetical protein
MKLGIDERSGDVNAAEGRIEPKESVFGNFGKSRP